MAAYIMIIAHTGEPATPYNIASLDTLFPLARIDHFLPINLCPLADNCYASLVPRHGYSRPFITPLDRSRHGHIFTTFNTVWGPLDIVVARVYTERSWVWFSYAINKCLVDIYNWLDMGNRCSLSVYIYTYIYIYICVCVCVSSSKAMILFYSYTH